MRGTEIFATLSAIEIAALPAAAADPAAEPISIASTAGAASTIVASTATATTAEPDPAADPEPGSCSLLFFLPQPKLDTTITTNASRFMGGLYPTAVTR